MLKGTNATSMHSDWDGATEGDCAKKKKKKKKKILRKKVTSSGNSKISEERLCKLNGLQRQWPEMNGQPLREKRQILTQNWINNELSAQQGGVRT
jgi:hypothetical protein